MDFETFSFLKYPTKPRCQIVESPAPCVHQDTVKDNEVNKVIACTILFVGCQHGLGSLAKN